MFQSAAGRQTGDFGLQDMTRHKSTKLTTSKYSPWDVKGGAVLPPLSYSLP